jgi:hypothetical protein
MDKSIPYNTITEVSAISKWDPGQKYCLRIATLECHYLIQVLFNYNIKMYIIKFAYSFEFLDK